MSPSIQKMSTEQRKKFTKKKRHDGNICVCGQTAPTLHDCMCPPHQNSHDLMIQLMAFLWSRCAREKRTNCLPTERTKLYSLQLGNHQLGTLQSVTAPKRERERESDYEVLFLKNVGLAGTKPSNIRGPKLRRFPGCSRRFPGSFPVEIQKRSKKRWGSLFTKLSLDFAKVTS